VPKTTPRKPPQSLSVLFVGNSFTARNDVPALVARIAEARGRRLTHALVSAGGASLRMHWNKGEAVRALASGRFDVLVLQEQSTLPVKNAARMRENVALFHGAATEAGVRTALYMTWARRHEPQNQRPIAEAYAGIAADLGLMLAPVGLAWEQFLAAPDAPVLHDRDGSHPTLAGSFLAACVIYRTLFGDRPEAVLVDGLNESDAALLARAAE
jgi:hypothetical protein